LDELHFIGDVETLSGGYWVPSPLRAVRTALLKRMILCGGIPTSHLLSNVRQFISWNGTARLISGTANDWGVSLPLQELMRWAGGPDVPLVQWTRDCLESLELKPFDDLPDSFEVYAPKLCANANIQYKRWKAISDKLPDGSYLARQKVGPMTHFVAINVKKGGITASTTIPERIEPRRLMYGIDALAGAPVRFKVSRDPSGTRVFLTSEVPKAERRLFTALGQLSMPSNLGYPRVWLFPNELMEQVNRALHSLGVGIAS
jgi:hypothetical protein